MLNDFIEKELSEPTKDINDYDMMDAFQDLSFLEKWKKVSEYLKHPENIGLYKWARLQQLRLLAPVSAVIVPMLLILIVGFLAAFQPHPTTVIPATIIKPDPIPELDPIKEEIIPPEVMPEPDTVDPTIVSDVPYAGSDPTEAPGPVTDFSPQPVMFDSVAMIKSPVTFRGIYTSRDTGTRGAAIAGNGGGAPGEFAVMRALRWLKITQNSDGSWGKTKPAMTGLALLTFLAHGETPGSDEFGFTVEQAMKWLLEAQEASGHFTGRDSHDYSHPIVAYALCEAYGMTDIPDIKYAAEKAIDIIIKGQHASGGWDYNCKQSDRDDTSYMGWCSQALKAAQFAKLDCEGLEQACKKSIDGFKKNFSGNYEGGGFGYDRPSKNHGLSPVGTLCIQLHNGGNMEEVLGSLKSYDNDAKWQSYDLDNPAPGNTALYYWYYLTQVKFKAGGESWNKWNKMFSTELVMKQNVISKENSNYVYKNIPFSIGYWDQYGGHGKDENPVFSTVLATLQLEVYYRYLPTFNDGEKVEVKEKPKNDNELVMQINI